MKIKTDIAVSNVKLSLGAILRQAKEARQAQAGLKQAINIKDQILIKATRSVFQNAFKDE